MHAWMLAAAIAALVVRVGPPALPATTSGGEVMFKLGLSAVGQVRTVEVLRDVPPFTEAAMVAMASVSAFWSSALREVGWPEAPDSASAACFTASSWYLTMADW